MLSGFIQRNEKFVRGIFSLLLAFSPLLIAFMVSDVPDRTESIDSKLDWLLSYTMYSTWILRFYLVFLGFVAVIYIFYYYFEQKKPISRKVYSGDDGYINFCRKRRSIVQKYKGKQLTNAVYATSHCNLFAKLDLVHTEKHESLKKINKGFFDALAGTIADDEGAELFLFLHYDSNDNKSVECAKAEWAEREKILNRNRINRREKFKPLKLKKKFLTDYFIIEDCTFLTMRKPESNQAQVTCLFIQDEEIADAYRSWLKRLADAPLVDGYCEEEALYNELKITR